MTDDTDDTTTTEPSGSEPAASTRDASAGADAAADPPSEGRAGDTSAGTGGDAPANDPDGGRSRDVVRYVNYLVLVALVVLALVSGIQFYGAVSRTINQWVTAEYRSLFHGAFNLAVLLIAAAAISRQVRRVTS
ncbi:hypothetical protein [Halobaculum rubrum]|uniref:hypothetical protein n=1 Tax=Halobaculum rubrum TaxID=2872158 RepID=UPI001CA45613|nr:hypothetical protein [Halobaculum rubrum]QZX99983.1 hypothetical protein K6T25_02420 [Halobaculum rubrum]